MPWSPSTRRAWIEIPAGRIGNSPPASPSTRRAWIEIARLVVKACVAVPSPSTRRAWIEIHHCEQLRSGLTNVALHPEGVDRN